jgi:predicted nucleic acid-binding protein
MTFSSSLTDDHRPLVLDTSVMINLHACAHGERVLTVIENKIIVPDIVAGELEHETSRKNGDHNFLHRLIERGEVTVAKMTDAEYELFAVLSGASPSLDDGEAATIAIAVHRKCCAVIDERKGRARAATLMNGEVPIWSINLLKHPNVLKALGLSMVSDAIYLALRHGRMRIPPEWSDEVVKLIGHDRALDCSCLPGFKKLSKELARVEQ